MEKKTLSNILLCLILAICGVYFLQKITSATDVVSLLNPPVQPSPEVLHMTDSIGLDAYELTFGQVGHRVDARFTLSNDSDMDIRNIRIFCTMHDENGKQWSDGSWYGFDVIPSHQQKVLQFTDKRYISSRAISQMSACQIVDLEILGDYTIASAADHDHDHSDDHGGHH